MLDSVGQKPALRDPAQLKLLLAPVFARSAEEQKRFYEVFDIYAEQAKRPQYEPVPPTFWEKLRAFFAQKQARWLLATATLAVAAFLIWKYFPRKKDSFPELRLETNRNVFAPGDTVRCLNLTGFTNLDSAEYQFSWRLERQFLDRDSAAVELEGGHGQTWFFIAPPAEFGIRRDIVLSVKFKDDRPAIGKISGQEIFGSVLARELRIACQNPPKLPKLKLPKPKLQLRQTATFALAERPKKGHHYRWQIIGDTLTDAPTLQRRFDREGTFEVQFLVSDSTQPGVCFADTSFQITVGDEKATLPPKPLQYDQALPTLAVGWAAWLLLALLAAGAGWFWWRWTRRKTPLPEAPSPKTPVSGGRGAAAAGGDKPPYYIPFRERKDSIRTAKEQFRLADAMRLRQQTEDLTLDLPATLRATMEGGGYPNFKFRHRTRPTEYLLLVDEQLPGHHLARLFRHLAETLRGQDVVLDLAWYDADLRRFWGRDLPKSVRFDGLRRFFPQHRLVLLGTGFGLLDEFSEGRPRLRPGLEAELNRWPQRLLLTPQSPVAWGWREAVLYRHFGLFPADLRGMLDAATFVENGLNTSDMPLDFGAWRSEQLEKRRPDANPEYLKWRTLADHEPYLRPYGDVLRRWFMALAVHPSPTWELTLAIARALDIAPTHDRLLALSRIPALREGRLNPGLRREMLQNLPPDDETLARQAVLDELQAIRHLTEGSHVAEETELYIAVQDFLLAPTDPEKGEALAAMFEAGMVSRGVEIELDVFVEKTLAQPDGSTAPQLREKMQGKPAKIRHWLEALKPETPEETPPPPPKKPFFTPDFWRAVACTVALLLAALSFFHPFSPVFDWPEKRETLLLGIAIAPDSARAKPPKPRIPLPEMIKIRGGTFTMGCTDEQGDDCYPNEKPAHQVTLSDFEMAKTEVTNEQFAAFLNEMDNREEVGVEWINLEGKYEQEKCRIQSPDRKTFSVEKGYEKHPVIYVSWYGAKAYCDWLSQKTGENYRLPTEAEWEFAARGGNLSKKTKYSGSNDLNEVGWFTENTNDTGPRPVGQKKANELGLFDMNGNVYEWCGDWYGDYPSGAQTNPTGAETGDNRVNRGGSWDYDARDCRVSYRYDGPPSFRLNYLGFRPVRQ